jgi:DeoR/GlpR family transcriptional regulator of sugar metabolism
MIDEDSKMDDSKKIFREERLAMMYRIIQEKHKVFVVDLAEQFNISESSVRLDLAELETRNLILRTHGGAILKDEITDNKVVIDLDSINDRITHLQKEKDAIARKTASLINDGDTIMIDGGSTTKMVAKYLADKKNLTVITNSIILIPDFLYNPNINLYSLGGLAQKDHGVCVGYMTDEFVAQFHPQKTILGIDGISLDKGLTAANPSVPAVSTVKRKMIEVSDQLIIVADHSKLNRICLMPVAPIDAMDILVTDSGAPRDFIAQIEQKGPRVIVAEC